MPPIGALPPSARTRRRNLIAAFVVLGVLATATFGSAASLGVNGSGLGSYSAAHPCSGTLAATTPTTSGTSTTVVVTPPAACAGRTIQVAVNDGTVVREGTATAPPSGSVTVTLNGA